MAINITHTENGIYCTHWSGSVSYEDMISVQEKVRETARQRGDGYYVLIFDMSQVPHLPFTPRQTGKLISPDDQVLRTIIVGASKSVRLVSTTVNMIFKQMYPIEHFDTMNEALDFARTVLKDIQAGAS